MARTTFQGPVRSLGGIYQQGPAAVVEITTSPTLSPEAHGGRIISVGGSLAAALTLTLPAINVSTNSITSGPGQDPSTANNEGVSWDRALDTLAKRYQEMPKPTGRTYKPTSIADIRKAMQAQATSILGRGLPPKEAKPLAQRIQQQETRQQTMASGEQPTSTSTLIEQGVQKDFASEARAFNFARFAQSALGYAGSSAGAQPDVELETMGGM